MAQHVGYFEDFKTAEREREAYSEGPFVVVNANGWRIECEVVGSSCPALPDLSVFHLRKKWGIPEGKFNSVKAAEELCDRLNEQVKLGNIVREKASWAATRDVTGCGTGCYWCVEPRAPAFKPRYMPEGGYIGMEDHEHMTPEFFVEWFKQDLDRWRKDFDRRFPKSPCDEVAHGTWEELEADFDEFLKRGGRP